MDWPSLLAHVLLHSQSSLNSFSSCLFFFSTPLTYKYTPKTKQQKSYFPSHQASFNSSMFPFDFNFLIAHQLLRFSLGTVHLWTIELSGQDQPMSTYYLIQWLPFYFFSICLWHCSLLASWNFLLVFCESSSSDCLAVFEFPSLPHKISTAVFPYGLPRWC